MKNTFETLIETIEAGNGFTVDLLGNAPMGGYAVALQEKSMERNIGNLVTKHDIGYHLQEFIRTNIVSLMDGAYLGCWLSPTKDVIFDVVEIEPSIEQALLKGAKRGQSAIWNLNTNREISL